VDVLGRVTHGYRWRGRAPGSLATASFLDGRATSVHLQAGLQ
jgi:hypothetical protein